MVFKAPTCLTQQWGPPRSVAISEEKGHPSPLHGLLRIFPRSPAMCVCICVCVCAHIWGPEGCLGGSSQYQERGGVMAYEAKELKEQGRLGVIEGKVPDHPPGSLA